MTPENLYYRFERFAPQDVFAMMKEPDRSVREMEGYSLNKLRSPRLLTYLRGGCKCRACNRVGTHFYAEILMKQETFLQWYFDPLNHPLPVAHLNLYGTDSSGREFMMTSDHVVPRSRGGSDGVENRVPLCDRCNFLKGNDVDWLTDLPKNSKGQPKHRPERQGKPGVARKELVHV